MRAGQKAQGKLSTQGASIARGARQQASPPPPQQQQHHRLVPLHQQHGGLQQQHQHHDQGLQQQHLDFPQQHPQCGGGGSGGGGVVVKQEVVEGVGEETGATWQSRQLLRKSIMDRRQAQGLGDILPATAASSPVQHQLSLEEIEKKERRKEQNRRAARKCRQKKKSIQSDIEGDFARMIADNKKLEAESCQLRAEVASLRKELDDHLQSGQCRQMLLDNACPATVPLRSSSPSTPPSFPTPCTPSLPPQQPAEVGQVSVSNYLTDYGDLSPEKTFTDLDTLTDLTRYITEEDVGFLHGTIPDANDNLKTLPLENPGYRTCPSTPTSPTFHNRHSVSSVASDLSDQSQGFGQVPTQGGSPAPFGHGFATRSQNSTGEWEGDLNSPLALDFCQQGVVLDFPMDLDINDDDVFRERGYPQQ